MQTDESSWQEITDGVKLWTRRIYDDAGSTLVRDI